MRAIFKLDYPTEGDDVGCPSLTINGDFDCSWQSSAPVIPDECMWLVYALMQRAYDKGGDDKSAEIRKVLGAK